MKKRVNSLLYYMVAVLIVVLVAFLAFKIFSQSSGSSENGAGISNPASVFCEQNGGKVEILETLEGQQGICVFEDGKRCDEWEYYRGECVK